MIMNLGGINNNLMTELIFELYNPIDNCSIGFQGTFNECVDWCKRNFLCDIRLTQQSINNYGKDY